MIKRGRAFGTIAICIISLFILLGGGSSIQAQVDYLTIREGIVSKNSQRIVLNENGIKATVKLGCPVMIAQAEQEEEWGYFQFPSIGRADDGTLIVGWSMSEDSHKAYGVKSKRQATLMMSKNGGRTWRPEDKKYFAIRGSYKVEMSNRDVIQVTNPSSKDISSYKHFPKSVGSRKGMKFYRHNDLPEDLQGIYFYHWDESEKKASNFHAKLEDENALRYAIDGIMPVVWWGDIKELEDHSLLAGIYPYYYLDENNGVSLSAVAFYQSKDEGNSWNFVGKIPFHISDIDTTNKNNNVGYQEPSFEVLKDSTLMCVMRTGNTSPMYKAFSNNLGKTWTTPEPFTPNGVKPRSFKLKNGVLVLVSGRPGIQVRFNLDGTGKNWTEPVDMIHFMKPNGGYQWDVSCGYASVIEVDDNSFYLTYSDFTTKDKNGEIRKSIWGRKITIKKK